jgi:hypothetical protein
MFEVRDNDELVVKWNCGFYSCTSIRLQSIIHFFNKHGRLPSEINSQKQFILYKPEGDDRDITYELFMRPEQVGELRSLGSLKGTVDYHHEFQFKNYKEISYASILPFVQKYFSPADEIKEIIAQMEEKYAIDYGNTCVLFYRGLDKSTEYPIPTYAQVFEQAHRILDETPNIRFLIQSDEQEFIDAATAEFPDSIVFRDETRAASRKQHRRTQVDFIYEKANQNLFFAKRFLAIMHIMSKATHVVCNSGNTSIWMCFFRGNADNVLQFFGGKYV